MTRTLPLVLLALCAGGRAADKKLRNVIITSFGELPYEPVEGFYQADVFPVDLDDKGQPLTMDVALRTRILVEDPNESKRQTRSEETSTEDEETRSTDEKRQVNDNIGTTTIRDTSLPQTRPKARIRRPKSSEYLQKSADQQPPPASSYIYQYRQTRKQRPPYPPSDLDSNGYNINREYYGDLGEGWDLQDAGEVLQGRNYNILVQSSPRHPSFPVPPPREVPPPVLPNSPPVFYHFPGGFSYKPLPRSGFDGPRFPQGYSTSGHYDENGYRQKRTLSGRSIYRHDMQFGQETKNLAFWPTSRMVRYAQNVPYNNYLSGI